MIPRYTRPGWPPSGRPRTATPPGSRSSWPPPRRWPAAAGSRRRSPRRLPQEGAHRRRAHPRDREEGQARRHRLPDRRRRDGRPGGALAALRPDLLRRRRHRARRCCSRSRCDLLLEGVDGLLAALKKQARRYKNTPMVGRTHGMHAEPITFGLKLLAWYEETRRNRERLARARASIAVGKISGAVGTYAHLDPAIEARGLPQARPRARPDLDPGGRSATGTPTTCSALALLATVAREVRPRDPPPAAHRGRRGRGAVHRGPEGLLGDAAQEEPDHLRADLRPRARDARLRARGAREHRALARARHLATPRSSGSCCPDASILMDYMLDRMTYLVAGFVVHPDVMRRNLGLTGGRMHSETVMLALTRTGLRREQAYEIVQRCAMEGMRTGRPLRELLGADPEVAQPARRRRSRRGVRPEARAALDRRDLPAGLRRRRGGGAPRPPGRRRRRAMA